MKNYRILIFLLSLLLLGGCRDNLLIDASTSDNDTSAINDDADDYVWDEDDSIQIVFDGSSIHTNSDGVSSSGNVVTINSAGTYGITGSLDDGQIVVDTNDEDLVRIILDDVDIHSSSSAPIYVTSAEKVMIVLADDTENNISDGLDYDVSDDNNPNAAIFSKADLTIYGNGTLNVDANYNDGITSKDGLIISGGNIYVNSVDDGIRGKDYLLINDGIINVESDGVGLKSDNEDDSTVGFILVENGELTIDTGSEAIETVNYIELNGGDFSITSNGKGINAPNNVTINGGTFNIDSDDDGIHSNGEIVINDGTITIDTDDDGIHADNSVTINSGTITVDDSYEGIESEIITVNDGTIALNSSDDAFNATAGSRTERDDGSSLNIYGGHIVIYSGADGLDSNGDITMSAGTVIVHGPSNQPEVMVDYNGTFKLSGGFLIATGSSSNMTQGPSTSSTQYSVLARLNSSISASTILHIEDSEGNNVLTFKPKKRLQSFLFSSSELKDNETYTLYKGGSSTGDESDGLYTNVTYSGGTQYRTFTISSTVTKIN